MPRTKADRDVDDLRELSMECFRAAEAAMRRADLGEMERQIEEAGHKELGYDYLVQVAVLTGDHALLKQAGEQAVKWATAVRSASTKRRNDEVPKLIDAMKDRRAWAQELLGIEEVD